MTKAEFVDLVARSAKLKAEIAERCVEATFDQITRAIRKDKRFEMPGFGTFTVRRRKARRGYDPNKGVHIMIPAARFVGFRAAPKLKRGI